MLEILSNIQTDFDLTDLAFSDVENLLEYVKSFEYILLATFWFKVLQRIDDVNKVLQYADFPMLMNWSIFRLYKMKSKILEILGKPIFKRQS